MKFTKTEKIFMALTLLMLIIVFISSSMTYHQQEISVSTLNTRYAFVEHMVKNWNLPLDGRWHNVHTDGLPGFTQFVMRKAAHFGVYFLISAFAYIGFRRIFTVRFLAPLFIWLSVTGLAAFDEFHQFLTGGRTPTIHDVMIDSTGALVGIIISIIIRHIIIRINKK